LAECPCRSRIVSERFNGGRQRGWIFGCDADARGGRIE
jgi:hypothetical protein